MKSRVCHCGCGQIIPKKKGVKPRFYVNVAHRMKAHRARHKTTQLSYDGLRNVTCQNCGVQFQTRNERQKFHSTSCRVSFHQQMKRIAAKDNH